MPPRRILPALLALLLIALSPTVARAAKGLPDDVIPNPLGVNIHFTDETPGELAQIAAAGVKIVRMDFSWVHVEREKGVYDFSAYDRLMDGLDRHGLRALFILDYANPHYDDNRSPDTDAGRAGFARFAAAAAARYKGRGVIWEMYNEPNIAPFWRPTPDPDDYVKLALATAEAVKAADPGATYIGPASSGIDFSFLQKCFDGGLLDHFAGISVHPYKQRDPETTEPDYRALRQMLRASGKPRPILSGEWGYSDIWAGLSPDEQAKMLARQWLFNLSQEIGLSIWYDWRDDGPDPKEAEHHFGIVEHPVIDPKVPFKPKPAFHAARTLTTQLSGYRYNKRIWTGDERDWVLLFARGDDVKLVVWTTSPEPRLIAVPASDGEFAGVNHLGQSIPIGLASNGRLNVGATEAPLYLAPTGANDALRLAAAWERPPVEVVAPVSGIADFASWTAEIRNPLDRPLELQYAHAKDDPTAVEEEKLSLRPGETGRLRARLPVARLDRPQHAVLTLQAPGVPAVAQRVTLLCANPWAVELRPTSPRELLVEIRNPSRAEGYARLWLEDADVPGPAREKLISLSDGQPFQWIFLDWPKEDPRAYAGRRLQPRLGPDGAGPAALIDLPRRRFEPVHFAADAWTISSEGDEKTASTQSIEPFQSGEHPIVAETPAIKIDYTFEKGWKYALLRPAGGPMPISAQPVALGMWVWGDGSGNILRCRFVDSAGQTFQPDGPKLDFYRWTYVQFPLDGTQAGHWGGDKSGIIKYPIRLETLLLIDSYARQPTGGSVKVAMPVLIYGE